jgi:hypothetical protein
MSDSSALSTRDREHRYLLGAVQLNAIVQELRRDVDRLLDLDVHLRLAGWDHAEVHDLVVARDQLDAAITTLERKAIDFRDGAPARCRYCRARLDHDHHPEETRCVFAPSATFGGLLSSRLRSWQLTFDPEVAHVP